MLQREYVLDKGATIYGEDGGNEDALGGEEVVEGGSKVGVGGVAVDPCRRGGKGRGRGRGSGREEGVVEVKKVVEEQDRGLDELLAALEYKVRFSNMADVAQKLKQLKMAMGSNTTQDDAFLSHLASNTVHYNPSDLCNWLESMLFELNAPPPPLSSCTPIPNHQSNQFELPPVPTVSASILDPTDCSTMTTIDFPTPRHQAEYDLKPASSAALDHVVHGSEPRQR